MKGFRTFRIHNENGRHRAGVEVLSLGEPGDGEVLIRVRYSSVNYKDALACTGRGRILRKFPLTGGIDACGDVFRSQAPEFREGDQVLVTGYGMSTSHDGGFAEYLQVPGAWVVPLPDGLSPFEAMALGTAGFTAALALHRLEHNGQSPETGPIVVTGASGGVGNIAVDLLAGRGYAVIAVSGKRDRHPHLQSLGAHQVLVPAQLPSGTHPLEKGLWGGAIDNVGGEMLAGLTRHVRNWGNIASIGLAGGAELHTTVMPFILRGISLLGINSADCPYALRKRLWQRLSGELRPLHLQEIVTREIPLEGLTEVCEQMLGGKTHGRIVVRIRP